MVRTFAIAPKCNLQTNRASYPGALHPKHSELDLLYLYPILKETYVVVASSIPFITSTTTASLSSYLSRLPPQTPASS